MPPPDRPYFSSWLRRLRRQLAPSGRLSEIALILSRSDGASPEWHAERLRAIIDGLVEPTLDEVTAIDLILARPQSDAAKAVPEPPSLF